VCSVRRVPVYVELASIIFKTNAFKFQIYCTDTFRPQFNQTLRPQFNQTLKPQFNQTLRPQFNQTLKPQFNQTLVLFMMSKKHVVNSKFHEVNLFNLTDDQDIWIVTPHFPDMTIECSINELDTTYTLMPILVIYYLSDLFHDGLFLSFSCFVIIKRQNIFVYAWIARG
jgi:hypothetical protein